MKEADVTIERLLAGLRDAQPSAGLERRILRAMEAHEITRSAWRPHLAMALALACTAVLALIVAITVHQRRPPATTQARAATAPQAIAQKSPALPRRTPSPVSARRRHTSEASAVAQTQAASFPAPPLPLTEQEKLLLRLVHRGDAGNLAILNPDVRAAQSARSTEQFQQFFGINATEMRTQLE